MVWNAFRRGPVASVESGSSRRIPEAHRARSDAASPKRSVLPRQCERCSDHALARDQPKPQAGKLVIRSPLIDNNGMNVADDADVRELIAIARREDFGAGDVTSALMPGGDERALFSLVAKQTGVLAGRQIAPIILSAYDKTIRIDWADGIDDGTAWSSPPATLATIHGPLQAVLSAERVLLNFLQRLCGVATSTRRYRRSGSGHPRGDPGYTKDNTRMANA